jgi:hypothetical protein
VMTQRARSPVFMQLTTAHGVTSATGRSTPLRCAPCTLVRSLVTIREEKPAHFKVKPPVPQQILALLVSILKFACIRTGMSFPKQVSTQWQIFLSGSKRSAPAFLSRDINPALGSSLVRRLSKLQSTGLEQASSKESNMRREFREFFTLNSQITCLGRRRFGDGERAQGLSQTADKSTAHVFFLKMGVSSRGLSTHVRGPE